MGETIAFPFESEEWNLSSIHIVIHAEPTDVPMLVKMNDDTKLISLEKKFQGYFNETISIDASKAALLNVKNQGDVNVALDVIVVDGDVVLDDVLMVNEVMQMSKILFVLSVIIVAIGMIMYFRNRKT
ncbi:hypothetical protein K0U27_09305 [archaeon]|nr:hypothetical protein [archaeon]